MKPHAVPVSLKSAPKTALGKAHAVQALVVPPEGQVWRFYYYAGGQRVALRVNQGAASDLYWLLSDHLGSTTLAAAGTAEAGELRYKPWGLTRYASGSVPTDRRFTGQVEESSLGLYFFGARWYDASLGRFLSADTLVPSPGNVLDWDRYSYVRNNPLTFTDPDGHRPCDGNGSDGKCEDVTTKDLTQLLSFTYGWKVVGKWLKRDLNILLDVGGDIEAHYHGLTGGWGIGWIRKNIGNAIFNHGPLSDRSFVLANAVFLSPNFHRWGKAHVAHELAHVIDNNLAGGGLGATILGGGKSDEMVRDVGGNPFGGRCGFSPYQCSTGYIEKVAGPDPWPAGAYGNNSVMDDFAETFAYSIYNPSRVPQSRLNWMNQFISVTVAQLSHRCFIAC